MFDSRDRFIRASIDVSSAHASQKLECASSSSVRYSASYVSQLPARGKIALFLTSPISDVRPPYCLRLFRSRRRSQLLRAASKPGRTRLKWKEWWDERTWIRTIPFSTP